MTNKKYWNLPTFSQLAHAALIWTAHASGQAAATGAFRPQNGDNTLDTHDGFDVGAGRKLLQPSGQQVGVPGMTPLAPAIKTPVAVLIPDNYNYGAFAAPLNTTLNRVRFAINDQGADIILYDLFAGNRSQSVDLNATRLSEAVSVVNLATSLGAQVVVGPSKDDVTMFTPGRPEMDRVPTNDTGRVLVTLAKALGNNTQVALMVGGQPKNYNGSLTLEIANRYDTLFKQIRATGFANNIMFKAPANYGQNLSYYSQGNTTYYNGQNLRFVIDLTSDGEQTEVNQTLDQCLSLKCLVTVGVQVNPNLGIYNTIDEVGRQLGQAALRGIPAIITPFADRVIQSDEGEEVMLAGDVRKNATAPVALSATGQKMLTLQREALRNASQVG